LYFAGLCLVKQSDASAALFSAAGTSETDAVLKIHDLVTTHDKRVCTMNYTPETF
jgi:hypothetical protein